MTRIDFYFNVLDKQKLLTGLVETAIAKHRKIAILAEDEAMVARVSDYLWEENLTSFLPNARVNHLHAARTPVVIGLQGDDLVLDDMLINLASNEPSIFSRFTQLVELVGAEEQDKVEARARFKFYRNRGYEIKSVDYAQMKTDKAEYSG
jgi:DNA polymerase III subunit chi